MKIDLSVTGPKEVTVNKRELTIFDQICQGDLSDIYECTFPKATVHSPGGTRFDRINEDEDNGQGVLKVATDWLDNDLLKNEATNLRWIYPEKAGDEKFFRYFPRLIDSFEVNGRQANLLSRAEGFISLADILKAYPAGIDFRDMVWMFKRVLIGLGYAHRQSVIHAAILPAHVLVHPTDHGAKIIDWSYSIRGDTRVSAMSAGHEGYYAPEIPAKQRVTAKTDIFMAAKCAIALIGGDIKTDVMPVGVPAEIQDFLKKCVVPTTTRPDDAWDLHDEFDALLRTVVGKPAYRAFRLP